LITQQLPVPDNDPNGMEAAIIQGGMLEHAKFFIKMGIIISNKSYSQSFSQSMHQWHRPGQWWLSYSLGIKHQQHLLPPSV
jgi:hypothetical protein